jgi:hypothetical protein
LAEKVSVDRTRAFSKRAGLASASVSKIQREHLLAVHGTSGEAWRARSAGIAGEDYVITRLDLGDALANALDDPCAFVAEDRGQRNAHVALTRLHIGAT